MFAGTIGVFTAHRPHGFALAINERTEKKLATDFMKNLILLVSGYGQISILARETMTDCRDYKCASQKLSEKHKLIAGAYIILAGETEGQIITRDNYQAVNIT